MSKLATLLLITVFALSILFMVGSVFAQAIPKPSVPEFTLKIIDSPYYVPPKYSTPDPYTGETTLIDDGYWAQNGTVILTIKNQPLTSNNDGNGHDLHLYYTIDTKGHFEGVWGGTYPPSYNTHKQYLPASNSDFTVVNASYGNAYQFGSIRLGELPDDSKVDFRIRAFIGYTTTAEGKIYTRAYWETYDYTNYTGQESDWSVIQTLSIPTGQVTYQPTPTAAPFQEPTPTPIQTPYNELRPTEQTLILGAAIAAVIIGAGLGLLFYLIKRK